MTPSPRRVPTSPGTDAYGRTPLHYAAADGDLARVRALLAAGADVGAADGEGWTPLHFAAEAQAPAVCEALLAAGAPVDAADAFGNTPLWRAAFSSRGRGDTIRALRAAGADPAHANGHGVSPAGLARGIANFGVSEHFADVP